MESRFLSALYILTQFNSKTKPCSSSSNENGCFPACLSSTCRLPDQGGSLSSGGRQDSVVGSGLPQTLQQEFSLVNLQIRNVNVEVRLLLWERYSSWVTKQNTALLLIVHFFFLSFSFYFIDCFQLLVLGAVVLSLFLSVPNKLTCRWCNCSVFRILHWKTQWFLFCEPALII